MPENIQVTTILRAEPGSSEITNPLAREFRVSEQLVPQQQGRIETRSVLVYELRDDWRGEIKEYNLPPVTIGILNRLANPETPLPIELIFLKKEAIGIMLAAGSNWDDRLESQIISIIQGEKSKN